VLCWSLGEDMVQIGEKNMFSLTDQETEFCTFFFTVSTFQMPENFFSQYLDCDKFTGRKRLLDTLEISQRELDDILNGTVSKIGLLEVDRYVISPFFLGI
jgi:hypothetical protein